MISSLSFDASRLEWSRLDLVLEMTVAFNSRKATQTLSGTGNLLMDPCGESDGDGGLLVSVVEDLSKVFRAVRSGFILRKKLLPSSLTFFAKRWHNDHWTMESA